MFTKPLKEVDGRRHNRPKTLWNALMELWLTNTTNDCKTSVRQLHNYIGTAVTI